MRPLALAALLGALAPGARAGGPTAALLGGGLPPLAINDLQNLSMPEVVRETPLKGPDGRAIGTLKQYRDGSVALDTPTSCGAPRAVGDIPAEWRQALDAVPLNAPEGARDAAPNRQAADQGGQPRDEQRPALAAPDYQAMEQESLREGDYKAVQPVDGGAIITLPDGRVFFSDHRNHRSTMPKTLEEISRDLGAHPELRQFAASALNPKPENKTNAEEADRENPAEANPGDAAFAAGRNIGGNFVGDSGAPKGENVPVVAAADPDRTRLAHEQITAAQASGQFTAVEFVQHGRWLGRTDSAVKHLKAAADAGSVVVPPTALQRTATLDPCSGTTQAFGITSGCVR